MSSKIRYRFLICAGVLAASLAALAPAASAGTEFKAPPFVRVHSPQHFPEPDIWFGYQGIIETEAKREAWEQQALDAPEATQAGGHPDFTASYRFAGTLGEGYKGRNTRTVVVDTPAGLVGNPRAVPRCPTVDFYLSLLGSCPTESQIGEVVSDAGGLKFVGPVSSLTPSPGVTAALAFKAFLLTVVLNPEVRSDGDYGLRSQADQIPIPPGFPYEGTTLTLWGVPHDPVHDAHRVDSLGELGGHIAGTPKPFLSGPTNCQSGPLTNYVKARAWENAEWAEGTSTTAEPTGCDQLKFEPHLSATPSTTVADSPSGLEVDLQTPQHEGCEPVVPAPVNDPADKEPKPFYDCELATSHLRDVKVTLPAGLALNPASANGLDGCSTAEVGLTTALDERPMHFTGKPANCPDASRVGDVEVDTPLLDAPLVGSVFLADPYDNPFRSFLALYIAVDDPQSGIVATLAGKGEADPVTGQLTSTFPENPQLPFEHFLIHFKQGPHAPLRIPAVCGTYETKAELTPYSAPDSPVATTSNWQVTQAPSGSCATSAATLPNSPSLDAGTVSPSAASYSPFVMHLRRNDGTQNFKAVTLSPPAGLTAKLAGVPQCPDAALAAAAAKTGAQEKASPSCPAASQVGTVVAGAGAGPAPYYAPGTAYLTGPYKGAPLSLAIVTPATAGPFDLGTVVVRTALYLDAATARITAVSDPFPEILQGIPLDIRTVDLSLDRDQFTKTGTSCDPASVDGQLTSTFGQVASIQSRFQLAECSSLGFKPKMSLRLDGGTTRGKHPALTAILTSRAGEANIAALSVALPHSEFIDQSHFKTICTRVQFAADACPPGAIYGEATVTTPLLDFPLKGHVYLRSSSNELPDLVTDFRGPASMPLKLEAAGKTDSINGGIRSSFGFVPDAPFTRLVVELRGGKQGLFQNSANVCSDDFRATVKYTAHNGKSQEGHPELRNPKCGKAKKRKGKAKAHKRLAAQRSAVR